MATTWVHISDRRLNAGEKNDGERYGVHVGSWHVGESVDVDDPTLEDWTNVLETANHVTSVSIDTALFTSADVTLGKLERFCDVTGNMKGLKGIAFRSRQSNPPINISYMARILQHARCLKELQFYCLTFDGTTREFEQFAAALSERTKLTLLSFPNCSIAEGKDLFDNVNPVLSVISTFQDSRHLSSRGQGCWIKNLICWIPNARNGIVPPAALLLPLARVLGHPVLNELTIESLALISSTIKYHGTSPKQLSLATGTTAEDFQHIAEIVEHGNRKLKSIKIRLRGIQIDDQRVAPFIAALGQNSTLKSFQVYDRTWDSRLSFSDDTLRAFAAMVETDNWTITKLDLPHAWSSEPVMQRIRYNLKLNLLGRSKLLKENPNGTPREAWIAKLHRSRNDISCLFYFLSMNPLLCDKCGEVTPIDNRAVAMRTRKKRKLATV